MPAVASFPVETLLLRVEKRDYTEGRGVEGSDGESPLAIVGVVVAVVTLIVAIASLRSSRFRRWAFHLLPGWLVKKALSITLLGPGSAAISTRQDLGTIPVADIPIPTSVLIYNGNCGIRLVSAQTNTAPYAHDSITGEDGRVLQAEESLGPRRPEPVVTGQFPSI
ncbi:hypothetical protein C7212DRAFT_342379 [Tuber magnatum]|uniref:Uncharacterized protein n=1 Tax=Tuber magnatum TaxID=42249 RepID=A0A317SU74_9PEZI|nr:hypothetical protein C7212DRAFT_342379 [Tuber magnatum]